MNPSRPPIHQIEDSMRPTWMAGDFGIVAKTIFAGPEALVSFLAIPFSAYMLDVAYGTGNVAIPLARQGTVVTGVDIPQSPPEPETVPPPKTSPLPSTKKMPSKFLNVHASFRKYLGSTPRGDFDGLFSLYPD